LAPRSSTRERLIRTAGELFWRQGYAATGVSQIMKRAGATSGSFYHFFPTKDELLLAVLDEVRRRTEDEVLDGIESTTTGAAGRVAALAEIYRAHAVPDAADYGLPLGALAAEIGSGHESARRRIDDGYEAVVERVASWFAEADGRRPHVAGDRRTAELVVASLEGAALMALVGGRAEPVDACAEALTVHIEGRARSQESSQGLPPLVEETGGVGDWKAW